ncbi:MULTISPECIES: response regulator [Pseudoalteromonas]|jgi:DNA-binding NtrC family response regulator|uniref:response regulator n=1 Tax=Pseudoalteromonas TaxID=53246 RepID=UPI00041947EC|nr:MULTISPECIES: response regulator [Pseudoalteromonas]USN27030.1 two-component system response regulator CreB [synthetic construct]MBB1442390.1 response regulator [Pseudoalteromonas sp. SG43-3]MBZ2191406.1 response regulator [Pseudoalteromonas arctica]MCK8105211.1 response regulator [Pseudoalteromonas sp. 2CM36K]MCK8137636.1 response regulator [Pseudoalteromonas sp. 2CM28B]|tara:strand:- start:6273 stop:6611 length:339 start_codon:yes stop_codon:yes gene_type:complete
MAKVLFIDDEPFILDAYARMLKSSAFECFTLSDSTQVFQHPELLNLDIIVVDHLMPQVTGVEILIALEKKFPTIKKVLISGDTHKLKNAPCDKLLQKPVKKIYLLDCLSSLI